MISEANAGQPTTLVGKLEQRLSRLLRVDIEALAYLVIFVLAILTRFWNLGIRAMSHDEVVHVHNSWNLYHGTGYFHAPWHHGPLLYHMTALSYYLFGDSDATSRFYPAVVGILVVMFPYLLRKWLGKAGALCASVFFLISPFIMYYSRYIREDMPAILFALLMVWASWRYFEERKDKWLIILAAAQALLFASKEVSFFYVAIFGLFFTLSLIDKLLDSPWEKPRWRMVFALGLGGIIVALTLLGLGTAVPQATEEPSTEEIAVTPVESPSTDTSAEETAAHTPPGPLTVAGIAVLGLALLAVATAAVIGQGARLRDYPALDICMVMGTLILPMSSALAIQALGFDPMDESPAGIQTSALIAVPFVVAGVAIGLLWGMRPHPPSDEETSPVSYWLSRIADSRWWPIGGAYWLIFIFLFTTMFTNGAGAGTGIVGSLGYWISQQGVRRGGHPIYNFLFVTIPLYEFLPLILSAAAGILGLIRFFRKPLPKSANGGFRAVLFIGFWVVGSLITYTLVGERMPWLTTHITAPMILLGGWVVGLLLERVNWRDWRTWALIALLPVTLLAVTRALMPLFGTTSTSPTQQPIALLVVLILVSIGTFIAIVRLTLQTGLRQTLRTWAAAIVIVLAVMTTRAAWMASFINYNLPIEFLDFAFSSRATTMTNDLVEELSIRTTGGLDLPIAYDDRVSWSMMWYFRNYSHVIYYGDDPTRETIGDTPMVLASESRWEDIEALLGNRYYQFEYTRMWWPMQDYFNLSAAEFLSGASDPEIRRGVWDIFWNRDFTAYGNAVGKNYDLSNWWPSEPMRLYIRRDIFAQVWNHGVAATEIAEALDPYSSGQRDILPESIFGQGVLNRPHGAYVGPDGLLYVADTDNNRIAVFDPAGEFVRAIGTDRLNQPWDLAVSADGYVYVADTWNHRIQKFTLEGEFVTEWGYEEFNPETTDPMAFYGPRGIAVDSQGNVYVADTGNKRIVVFNSDGEFLEQISTGGNLAGQLDEPVGIAVTDEGNVYVADTWNQRVQVFDASGQFLDTWEMSTWYTQTNERPYLEIDAQGLVYVSDPDIPRILVFAGDGRYLYSFGDLATLSMAGAVLVGEDGSVYVIDTEASIIQRYSLAELESAPSGDEAP